MEIPKITWREWAMLFLGRRRAFLVEGDSMAPTIVNGDSVLVNPHSPIETGDIVAADHPFKKSVKLIKRVESIDRLTGRIELHGDNPDSSTDSRSFGAISKRDIAGKVVCRF